MTTDLRDACETLVHGAVNAPECNVRLFSRVLRLVAAARDPARAALDALDAIAEHMPPIGIERPKTMAERLEPKAARPMAVSGK